MPECRRQSQTRELILQALDHVNVVADEGFAVLVVIGERTEQTRGADFQLHTLERAVADPPEAEDAAEVAAADDAAWDDGAAADEDAVPPPLQAENATVIPVTITANKTFATFFSFSYCYPL